MTDDNTLGAKIRDRFGQMAIYKDPVRTAALFAGRNLPAFVRDFLTRRFTDTDGNIDDIGLCQFLDKVLPKEAADVKDRLSRGEEVVVLARFNIYIDLTRGERRFAIPDLGIRTSEGIIPAYTYNAHEGELIDGEHWGIIKMCLMPDAGGGRGQHVEMTDYKPFKPYRSVDMDYLREARRGFTTDEWIDFLLTAMEYDPAAIGLRTAKLEMLTRLLVFVEPRLNVVELAPKGTGKSYVMGNLSKYGWLISGGKVTRAKLFFDKTRQQPGIIKNHDFTAMDEVQTITFQEPAEIQAALKSYLESGKTTIDNNEFSSECGMMLMGNLPLTADHTPACSNYFDELPRYFRESALLDRFHCFIEGWLLPRINKAMIYRGWTVNVEYFSELLHALRTENIYAHIFDTFTQAQRDADLRDYTAVRRIATGYIKLLFPHWTTPESVDADLLDTYCLQPALRRRGIIKEQCHRIDPEFGTQMPEITLKQI